MDNCSSARALRSSCIDSRPGPVGLLFLAMILALWAGPSLAQTQGEEKGPEGNAPEVSKEPEPDEQAPSPKAKKKKGKKQKKLKGRALEKKIEALPEKYRQWVEAVRFIISDEELVLFVEIEKDYLRDAFIERFWKVRDPYPDSARNEFRENYNERIREAQQHFGGKYDDRTKVLLTNGYPLNRIEIRCRPLTVPLEVWYYDGSDTVGFEFLLLFYQKWGVGDFRLWEPGDGLQELALEGDAITRRSIESSCRIKEAEALIAGLGIHPIPRG